MPLAPCAAQFRMNVLHQTPLAAGFTATEAYNSVFTGALLCKRGKNTSDNSRKKKKKKR